MTVVGFVYWYLSVGGAIYIVCLVDALITRGLPMMMKDSVGSIIMGILGIFGWPLVIMALRNGYKQ